MSWDHAQWFDPLGSCRKCGKTASGILHSYYHNTSLGAFCERCAKALIKAAHKRGQFAPDAALPQSTDASMKLP